MSKTTYILALVMLCSVLSYGQQIIFHKNLNFRANSLQQSLNEEEDRIVLESETEQILKVSIFNDFFSENIDVFSHKTEIDLTTLPYGDFVIQAKLGQKWIVMYLEKKEDLKITSHNEKKRNTNAKTESLSETESTTDGHVLEFIQNPFEATNDNESLFYWVVTESNSSFGSSKTMRLEYKDDIYKLISKNKLELKSNIGKANKLIIYEVYNKSEFMDKQFRNPAYYTTEEASKFLNTDPLYVSSDEVEDGF